MPVTLNHFSIALLHRQAGQPKSKRIPTSMQQILAPITLNASRLPTVRSEIRVRYASSFQLPASSRDEERGYGVLVGSRLSNSIPPDPTDTSSSDISPTIYRTSHSYSHSHKRLNTTFFTYAVVLLKTCKYTLMCKIGDAFI